MAKYTVIWHPSCEADLAEFWLASPDPGQITRAADELDVLLQRNPGRQGVDLHEGLRVTTVPPLKIVFSVSEKDRLVQVWKIKLVPYFDD
jgi:hypothetical protein